MNTGTALAGKLLAIKDALTSYYINISEAYDMPEAWKLEQARNTIVHISQILNEGGT